VAHRGDIGNGDKNMVEAIELVGPYETGRWFPVATLAASRPGQWCGLDLTDQEHEPWGGRVPPLRNHLVTAFLRQGRVRRKLDGPWQCEDVAYGDVSFISRAMDSYWEWNEPLENIHFHISDHYFSRIAREVFGRDDHEIFLVDRLKIRDPFISSALEMLAREARSSGYAEHLYVDAISTQLCVYLLRHYSTMQSATPRPATGLTASQASRVSTHIEEKLGDALTIEELARQACVSPFHFARQFKLCFGLTPHNYVVTRRLERAHKMVAKGEMTLKQIASRCGFYDQAHMTVLFRRKFGMTPKKLQLEKN
jgi:AraC family transcriptional regulator